jgi:hypothetical protein
MGHEYNGCQNLVWSTLRTLLERCGPYFSSSGEVRLLAACVQSRPIQPGHSPTARGWKALE